MEADKPRSALSEKVREVAQSVADHRGRALLVGGFVRDELLGLPSKDADLEVYGLEAPVLRELLSKLGRVGAVGESFRVYKLTWRRKGHAYEIDVSLPRRERKVAAGHKGFEVEGDPYSTIEAATRRRDFTVNAILQDPLSGELIDLFGGQKDLHNKVLRAVDSAHFGEDSLRVLRAMQFSARFCLTLEEETVQLCRGTPLNDLPRERVWGEVEKWLLKAPKPSLGLRAGAELGIFERLFPYLQAAYDRRGTAVEEALDAGSRLLDGLPEPHRAALMLAIVGSFLGSRDTVHWLDALNIYKMRESSGAVDVRRLVIQLVSARKRPGDWFATQSEVTDKDIRYFSALVMPRLAVKLTRARGETAAAAWLEAYLEKLRVLDGPPEPLLLGRHLLELGWKPGKEMGQALQNVYARQLAGEIENLEQAVALARSLSPAHKYE